MRKTLLILLLVLYFGGIQAQHTDITPLPKSMSVQEGNLELPHNWNIDASGLDSASMAVVRQFATDLSHSLNMEVTVNGSTPTLMKVRMNSQAAKMGEEAYRLRIEPTAMSVEAETEKGFFYAFQSIKKLLPEHVALGYQNLSQVMYSLPCITVDDAPRFSYRGYMLDVSRHFFDVQEIKRLLDIMAVYKMNKFHWHLTDDQGWRVEIKKYPKLTTVGAQRKNSYNTDYPGTGQGYTTNEPYGPYFYTQDEIREVVAYAKARQIDVIPEVDMPGHFQAALAAYPEYSCNPNAVYEVWNMGGISTGVLNVANPQAIAFVKDILSELCDLFPYPYIHIGGDECPTSPWEGNAQCQALKQQLGYDSFRKLQSHFTKEISDYLATKGRKIIVWNETVTAQGSDLDQVRSTDATVMCWVGAENAAKAATNIGLKNILTPQPTYYINRKQSTDPSEPSAAGNGTDNLQAVYNYVPGNGVDPATIQQYYMGVQGTFWTEHVNTPQYLEYLTLPRLMAIAETGWSQAAAKNFDHFVERMKRDTMMLNLGNYDYGRHYLRQASTSAVYPHTLNEGDTHWYRLITLNTSDTNRKGKCIELLAEGDAQVGKNGAAEGMLWSAVPSEAGSADYDYQQWGLKEDPNNPGRYALVCKALPQGSVNPNAGMANNAARWRYDKETIHYNFVLSDAAYQGSIGNNRFYAIRSVQYTNWWMNMAASGQNYAINMWNNPKDGNGGLWEFAPMFQDTDITATLRQAQLWLNTARLHHAADRHKAIGTFEAEKEEALRNAMTSQEAEKIETALAAFKNSQILPQEGMQIRLVNNTETSYKNHRVVGLSDGSVQNQAEKPWQPTGWTVQQATQSGEYFLRSMNGGKALTLNTDLLTLGEQGTAFRFVYRPEYADFSLTTDGTRVWIPVSPDYFQTPGAIKMGAAIRALGDGWMPEEVAAVVYLCSDEQGNTVGTFTDYVAVGVPYHYILPQISGYSLIGQIPSEEVRVEQNDTLRLNYRRTSYMVQTLCLDRFGNLLHTDTAEVAVGEKYIVTYPTLPYYTVEEGSMAQGTELIPEAETVIRVSYSTEGRNGFARCDKEATEVLPGRQYLIYNNTAASGRSGYIYGGQDMRVYTKPGVTAGTPEYVWTTAEVGGRLTLQNAEWSYMPEIPHGDFVTLTDKSASAGTFVFRKNADGRTYTIQGSNGNYFNGNAGSFTGWSDAHPYIVYELVPQVYFSVTCRWQDETGKNLRPEAVYWIKAGEAFVPDTTDIDQYSYIGISNPEELASISGNVATVIRYKAIDTKATEIDFLTTSQHRRYDLQGRRIEGTPRQGIYIEGKKKVLGKVQ